MTGVAAGLAFAIVGCNQKPCGYFPCRSLHAYCAVAISNSVARINSRAGQLKAKRWPEDPQSECHWTQTGASLSTGVKPLNTFGGQRSRSASGARALQRSHSLVARRSIKALGVRSRKVVTLFCPSRRRNCYGKPASRQPPHNAESSCRAPRVERNNQLPGPAIRLEPHHRYQVAVSYHYS